MYIFEILLDGTYNEGNTVAVKVRMDIISHSIGLVLPELSRSGRQYVFSYNEKMKIHTQPRSEESSLSFTSNGI